MTGVVLGVVPPSPSVHPVLQPGWERTQITLDGWDGSHWDLTDPSGGVFLIRGGVRGFADVKATHYRDQSPAVAGAVWRGLSYEPRELFWPIHLFHDGSTKEWVERDAAWWRALHPEHESTVTVRIPGVSSRTLRVRLSGDGDWAPDIDPSFFGWASYGITLQADQPFWEGEAIPLPWEQADLVPFFSTTGVIAISNSGSLATASVTNPGDVETYPVWTVHGASTTASIGVDGRIIEVPIAIAEGGWVRIDTRPTEQTAYNQAGVDVFSGLGQINFAPIPAGDTATLALTMTGTGRIELEMTPLYRKPY